MAEFKTCYTLFLLILLICSGALALNPVSAQLFSNVQITIQISNSQSNYFVVNAYNMSGYLEASTQTHYPTASFELPKNQYIFTVTANNASAPSPVPLLGGSGSTSNGTASPLLPLYVAPAVEYGYAIEQVTGSTSLTIATKNVNQYPTNTLTVKVSYANGTAAQGAYVSASVMGSSYYWGYEPDVITWATSGSDGTATLVAPTAPLQLDSWLWATASSTGYPVPETGVSGQTVNGSVIATPVYVGLAGSTIVLPPQTTVYITLQPQQNNYWVTPALGATSGETNGSYAAGHGSVPSSVYAQQQGNPNLPNAISEFPVTMLVLIALSAVFAFAVYLKKSCHKNLLTPTRRTKRILIFC